MFSFSICSVLLTVAAMQGNALIDVCRSLSTCSECIRVTTCVWCSQLNYNSSRCQLQNEDAVHICPSSHLISPNLEYNVTVNKPFPKSRKKIETGALRPQKASLAKLRLGQSYNFSLQFKAVKNYPADLYYLMDVSESMYYDKINLIKLAGNLVEAMKNIASDFKIGFGSFSDKNVLPFIDELVDRNATCGDFECITYSFTHQLSLSEDVNNFTNAVNSTKIIKSSAFDYPEGGFDALLQAMICKEEIGWRQKSRRLIVFATDAFSHLAGNGRVGGILKPNDGKCHLDSRERIYIEAENQDYPSLGQISRVAKENSINLIFAVTNNHVRSYQKFSKLISGSSVSVLDADSQNIVDVVRTTYEKITSSVEMTHTAGAGVKVRYYTACTGNDLSERNKCEDLKVNDVVDFTISIELTECPMNKTANKKTIEIKPVGMNETMTLELEIICNCPCETLGNPDYFANATECNYGGDLQCGVCSCDDVHSGINCECSADSTVLAESQCTADNTSDVLCNNRGDCICGNCVCHGRPNPLEVISGKHCECDNFSCARASGNLCSNHGECKCGHCQCNPGWQGIDCDCVTSKEGCIPPGGGGVCFGNGLCECGSCICFNNTQGTFCQDCPSCASKCDEFKPCIECKVFETGLYTNEICAGLCTYSIIVEETVQVFLTSERYCSYLNESNCEVSFIYGYDDTTGAKYVRVKRDPVCPPPQSLVAIGIGLLGAIVLAGLIALLAYRLTTYYKDKREYARFREEREIAKWNRESNPLYHEPTTTFKNPFYDS